MISILDEGIVFAGVPGGNTNHCGFPGLCILSDGSLLSCWRIGSAKDSIDGNICLSASRDRGRTWSRPESPFLTTFDGQPGELHACKITELFPGHLLACLMWFDRSDPTLPMFNPQTEGILPVKVLLSRSQDNGRTWGPLWAMDDSPYGPTLTITGPVVVMPDGRWMCQFEVNKPYCDDQPWRQEAAVKFSDDEGRTWSRPIIVASDPQTRIRYWDQRLALTPNGNLQVAFWTFDSVESRDLNITLSRSTDGGANWTQPHDIGIPGQVPYPVPLSNDRMLLLYVERFENPSIRARICHLPEWRVEERDTVIYQHRQTGVDPGADTTNSADYLQQQQLWTFGLPLGMVDAAGDVWVTYYNTGGAAAQIHWARLRC